MIKVVEFEHTYHKNGRMLSTREFGDEIHTSALEQLNEYLNINDKEIDLIEVQTHSDRFVLVYNVVVDKYLASDEYKCNHEGCTFPHIPDGEFCFYHHD